MLHFHCCIMTFFIEFFLNLWQVSFFVKVICFSCLFKHFFTPMTMNLFIDQWIIVARRSSQAVLFIMTFIICTDRYNNNLQVCMSSAFTLYIAITSFNFHFRLWRHKLNMFYSTEQTLNIFHVILVLWEK